jgi:hypothetical protein
MCLNKIIIIDYNIVIVTFIKIARQILIWLLFLLGKLSQDTLEMFCC